MCSRRHRIHSPTVVGGQRSMVVVARRQSQDGNASNGSHKAGFFGVNGSETVASLRLISGGDISPDRQQRLTAIPGREKRARKKADTTKPTNCTTEGEDSSDPTTETPLQSEAIVKALIILKRSLKVPHFTKQTKKWSKGKQKKKVNNMVMFDKATYDNLLSESPKYKLITPSVISDHLTENMAWVLKKLGDANPDLKLDIGDLSSFIERRR